MNFKLGATHDAPGQPEADRDDDDLGRDAAGDGTIVVAVLSERHAGNGVRDLRMAVRVSSRKGVRHGGINEAQRNSAFLESKNRAGVTCSWRGGGGVVVELGGWHCVLYSSSAPEHEPASRTPE